MIISRSADQQISSQDAVFMCHVCTQTSTACEAHQRTINYYTGHSESNITFRQLEMLLSSGDQLSWFEQKEQFANTEQTTSFDHLHILTSV